MQYEPSLMNLKEYLKKVQDALKDYADDLSNEEYKLSLLVQETSNYIDLILSEIERIDEKRSNARWYRGWQQVEKRNRQRTTDDIEKLVASLYELQDRIFSQ